jgi:hypothetical protein
MALFSFTFLRVEVHGFVTAYGDTFLAAYAAGFIHPEDAVRTPLDCFVPKLVARILTGGISALLAGHGEHLNINRGITAALTTIRLSPSVSYLDIVLLLAGKGAGITADTSL